MKAVNRIMTSLNKMARRGTRFLTRTRAVQIYFRPLQAPAFPSSSLNT